jgi:hypothetical protein
METLWVVAGGHYQCGCSVRPDTETIEKFRNGGHQQRFDPLVELSQLLVEGTDPVRQRGERCLGRGGHRVGRTGRPKLDPFGHQSRDTQTLQSASQLVRAE